MARAGRGRGRLRRMVTIEACGRGRGPGDGAAPPQARQKLGAARRVAHKGGCWTAAKFQTFRTSAARRSAAAIDALACGERDCAGAVGGRPAQDSERSADVNDSNPLPLDIPPADKRCSRCGVVKAAAEFNSQPSRGGRLVGHCKDCQRWRMRRRNYGLDRDGFAALLAAQNGGCAVCGTTEPLADAGMPDGWCVDHDHATGDVRGILCRFCNSLLGNARDDPSRLELAAAYLRRHCSD